MKIKLDENIPASLRARLVAFEHDVDTVLDEGIVGATDSSVWAHAQQDGRFLITQDMDFSNIRQFVPGSHAGIALVRLHSPSAKELVDRLEAVFRMEQTGGWRGCFVVVTDLKVRVIRPK